MKSMLVLAVLAVIAAITDSTVIDRSDNPNVGEIGPNDENLFGPDVSYRSVVYNLNDDGSIALDDGNQLGDLPSQPDLTDKSADSRWGDSLFVGMVGPNDRTLASAVISVSPINNVVQVEDVTFRGNAFTFITAIQSFPRPPTNTATPRIISGGVGSNQVTIRYTSQRGLGYNYMLSIFGWVR